MRNSKQHGRKPSTQAWRHVSQGMVVPLVLLTLVSAVSNILMLTGPLFMLQIYDRVIPSRSLSTLVTLFGLVVFLYAFYAATETIRLKTLSRFGRVADERLTHKAFLNLLEPDKRSGDPHQQLRNVDKIRSFISSPGPLAFLDLPWTPLYLAVIFLMHSMLGWLAAGSLLIVVVLMLVTEFISRRPMEDATVAQKARDQLARDVSTNVEAVTAMGMERDLAPLWNIRNSNLVARQQKSTDRSGLTSSITKSVRLLVQSSVLAVGAVYVLAGEISPGVMIAASIITARALSPIEQLVAHWRSFLAFRSAMREVSLSFKFDPAEARTKLPIPKSSLHVTGLIVNAPAGLKSLIRDVDFHLIAGEAMGIVGPSGVGKTSLARTLVGVQVPLAGEIRIDGALLNQLLEQRIDFIGYLPQNLDLMSGTVAQNISRFSSLKDDEPIVAAALAASAHEMILKLPNGYDTQVGDRGHLLSAGQRQRIGLARALYADPFLLILDEPNSHLDVEGDMAMASAIRGARERGAIVIVIAHRPSSLTEIDKVLYVSAKGEATFGDKTRLVESVTGRVSVPR